MKAAIYKLFEKSLYNTFDKQLQKKKHTNRKRGIMMTEIKGISDLGNYTENWTIKEPTSIQNKNRICSAADSEEYEKRKAVSQLTEELMKGKKSGQEKGWIDLIAIEKHLNMIDE